MEYITKECNTLKSYNAIIKLYKNGLIKIKFYDNRIYYRGNEYELYDSKMDTYNKMDTFMQTVEKYKRRIEYIENMKIPPKVKIKTNNETLKQVRKDSLARTRNSLIDYASQNDDKFHSFITLTFEDNVQDIEKANKLFKNFVDQWRRKKNSDFYYLGVPEFQKRGAVHYHILTSLKHDEDIIKKPAITTYNSIKNKKTKIEYYDIDYWNYGYSSSFDLDNTDENFNVALYITKYLYKDLDNRLFGHKKLLKSNNLEKPNIYKLNNESKTYQYAIQYIIEKINDNKITIQNQARVQSLESYGYSYNLMELKLQENDSIIQDILQDQLPFL